MLRFIALAVAIALIVGCRAPAPSFKVLAPGATRIPPPATDSYRGGDSYYPSSTITTPPIGSGMKPSPAPRNQLGQSPRAVEPNEPAPSVVVSRSVQNASFDTPTRAAASRLQAVEPRIRVVDARSVVSSASSRVSASQPFRPASRVAEITQLPPATRTRPPAGRTSRSSSAVAAPPPVTNRPSIRADSSSWRARKSVDSSVRIAGR